MGKTGVSWVSTGRKGALGVERGWQGKSGGLWGASMGRKGSLGETIGECCGGEEESGMDVCGVEKESGGKLSGLWGGKG